MGQIATLDTHNELSYYSANFQKIIATRQSLGQLLTEMGFKVFHSQTNFILVRPPHFPSAAWLEKLRAQKILVRWFNDPMLQDFLRISIGTPEDSESLVKAAKVVLQHA